MDATTQIVTEAPTEGGTGQVTAPALDYSKMIDASGNFTAKDWAGQAKGMGEKFTSLPALVKSYATLERLNSSGNKVALPTETSTDDEKEAFYSKVRGVKEAKEYEMPIPESLKSAGIDPKSLDAFKEVAFKNGVSKQALSALAAVYFGQTEQGLAGLTQAKEQAKEGAIASLEKDWGPRDGQKFKAQHQMAERGAAISGLDGDVLAENPDLANNPHFIRAMVKVASLVGEKGQPHDQTGGNTYGESIDAQIKAIMNDKGSPYWVKGHPEHGATVAKLEALFRAKNAGKP